MEGSKSVEIQITKDNVIGKVKTSTYYTGEARKNIEGLLEVGTKMQASDDDTDFLNDAYMEAVGKLTATLNRTAGPATFTSGSPDKFTVMSQANFNDTVIPALQSTCETYLSDYILFVWLSAMKPDEANVFSQKLTIDEKDIRDLACERKKPVRS